jgi:hypothetical protein
LNKSGYAGNESARESYSNFKEGDIPLLSDFPTVAAKKKFEV